MDGDLARDKREQRCPHCGGPLYQSNYVRKPRGGPPTIPEAYLIRESLCCGREGCRKRTLPPSCLFMGRRVYWGCVILVVMALRQKRPRGASARKLQTIFEISRSTLARWFAYFKEAFPRSAKWQQLRGRVICGVENDRLPASLLECFLDEAQTAQGGLVGCLVFLS
ncbi:MAG: hypothetical protein HGA74_07480 [Deltaproteobacteria bacterium]|nr:hypothetical protein [Deltaproteobacteria bacterium]NTV57113.1 hypothetical protein [Deltaproteobacteria bacterium]